jgi:hypothetical protein
MQTLTSHLERNGLWKPASKKPIKYEMKPSLKELTNGGPCTFTVYFGSLPTTKVVTYINNKRETTNQARQGDVIIKGPFGEKYVMTIFDFFRAYNVNDGIAIPRKTKKLVAQYTPYLRKHLDIPQTFTFMTGWGQDMVLNVGDYVVKDKNNSYYRIEAEAFRKTYRIETQ